MFVARSIAADHRDLIHDVSFDFHGRRMATCSSDQSVKLYSYLSAWTQWNILDFSLNKVALQFGTKVKMGIGIVLPAGRKRSRQTERLEKGAAGRKENQLCSVWTLEKCP
ncbi:uncharacterized protein LOC135980198 isoform X3 [Chrysemys picta bellii]|uniref:uncharacterized protein LOC135980198 isoform X3 n=1 Tax=Chrysemys picta bellii TaxID=8478 RepID=UPI0032B16510